MRMFDIEKTMVLVVIIQLHKVENILRYCTVILTVGYFFIVKKAV